jgi:hypothetical protein
MQRKVSATEMKKAMRSGADSCESEREIPDPRRDWQAYPDTR